MMEVDKNLYVIFNNQQYLTLNITILEKDKH